MKGIVLLRKLMISDADLEDFSSSLHRKYFLFYPYLIFLLDCAVSKNCKTSLHTYKAGSLLIVTCKFSITNTTASS